MFFFHKQSFYENSSNFNFFVSYPFSFLRKCFDELFGRESFWKKDICLAETSKGTSNWLDAKWVFVYLIWAHRNIVVFKGEKSQVFVLLFEFQRLSFDWVKSTEKTFREQSGASGCRIQPDDIGCSDSGRSRGLAQSGLGPATTTIICA